MNNDPIKFPAPGSWLINDNRNYTPDGCTQPLKEIEIRDKTNWDVVVARVSEMHQAVTIAAVPDLLYAIETIERVLAGHPEADCGNSKVHYCLQQARLAKVVVAPALMKAFAGDSVRVNGAWHLVVEADPEAREYELADGGVVADAELSFDDVRLPSEGEE